MWQASIEELPDMQQMYLVLHSEMLDSCSVWKTGMEEDSEQVVGE